MWKLAPDALAAGAPIRRQNPPRPAPSASTELFVPAPKYLQSLLKQAASVRRFGSPTTRERGRSGQRDLILSPHDDARPAWIGRRAH